MEAQSTLNRFSGLAFAEARKTAEAVLRGASNRLNTSLKRGVNENGLAHKLRHEKVEV